MGDLPLCDIAKDRCGIVRDGKFLYSYTDHISDFANSMLATEMSASMMGVIAPVQLAGSRASVTR